MAESGWYPDPSGSGRQRWFDGSDWTDHYAPDQPATAQTTTSSFGAAPEVAEARSANPLMGVLAGLVSTVVLLVVGMVLKDSSIWDGFDTKSYAVSGAIHGAALGLGLALLCMRRFRRNPWPAVAAAAAGGALGAVGAHQLIESATEPGFRVVAAIALFGAGIGLGFGLVAGGRAAIGGLVGGALSWAIAAGLSGGWSFDVDWLRLPILGPEFNLDVDPHKVVIALLIVCVGTAVAIERTAD